MTTFVRCFPTEDVETQARLIATNIAAEGNPLDIGVAIMAHRTNPTYTSEAQASDIAFCRGLAVPTIPGMILGPAVDTSGESNVNDVSQWWTEAMWTEAATFLTACISQIGDYNAVALDMEAYQYSRPPWGQAFTATGGSYTEDTLFGGSCDAEDLTGDHVPIDELGECINSLRLRDNQMTPGSTHTDYAAQMATIKSKIEQFFGAADPDGSPTGGTYRYPPLIMRQETLDAMAPLLEVVAANPDVEYWIMPGIDPFSYPWAWMIHQTATRGYEVHEAYSLANDFATNYIAAYEAHIAADLSLFDDITEDALSPYQLERARAVKSGLGWCPMWEITYLKDSAARLRQGIQRQSHHQMVFPGNPIPAEFPKAAWRAEAIE